MGLREKVLNFLENYKGSDISGQELADELGVSRGGIWKAVKQLQSEGHNIVATTNKGYKLEMDSDKLTEQGIRNHLSEANAQFNILVYDTVDSTNTLAKRLIGEGLSEDTLIVSEEQTAGRGRFGKSFHSPKEKGIYMSIVLHKHLEYAKSTMITTTVAVCVAKAIEELIGESPKIKWVNDLFLNGKKICGILTEATTDFESGMLENIIIGIGINCKEQLFPENLQDIATTLGRFDITRNELIARILNLITEYFGSDISIIEDYKSRSMTIGKEVEYSLDNKSYSGRVLTINEMGHLIVQCSDGETHTLSSGHITFKENKREKGN